MLQCKLCTKDYNHDYIFEFKGQKYHVHSIVRLTEEGRLYLGSLKREVILAEQFTNFKGVLCWKYQFKSVKLNAGIIDMSTDKTPDELIEEVIVPATINYASREMLGVDSPVYKDGIKQMKKDREIPEVIMGWTILIVIFIGASIFKDWYVQFIIRAVASLVFGLYRQTYIDAYTTYTHQEDSHILRQKYETLYGPKNNKENEEK